MSVVQQGLQELSHLRLSGPSWSPGPLSSGNHYRGPYPGSLNIQNNILLYHGGFTPESHQVLLQLATSCLRETWCVLVFVNEIIPK